MDPSKDLLATTTRDIMQANEYEGDVSKMDDFNEFSDQTNDETGGGAAECIPILNEPSKPLDWGVASEKMMTGSRPTPAGVVAHSEQPCKPLFEENTSYPQPPEYTPDVGTYDAETMTDSCTAESTGRPSVPSLRPGSHFPTETATDLPALESFSMPPTLVPGTETAIEFDSYNDLVPSDFLSISYGLSPSGNKPHKNSDKIISGKKNTSSSRGQKRKSTASINMLEFVRCLHRIIVNIDVASGSVNSFIVMPYIEALCTTGVERNLSSTTLKQRKITSYITGYPRLKPSSIGSAVEKSERPNDCFVKCPDKSTQKSAFKARENLCLDVLIEMFVNLEKLSTNLLFSKEHLKYFLATYPRFIAVSDFIETNSINDERKRGPNQKKHRATSRLGNGAILVEYSKYPYLFASNLSRCEANDVEAIRYIVENNISLPSSIYNMITWKMEDVCYVVDQHETVREGYVFIEIGNYKRAALLITKNVILQYDGNQFLLPAPNVERDITSLSIASAQLKGKEYIVLDVLLANKIQVIDIITTNKEDLQFPNDYVERLLTIKHTLKDVKTVSVDRSGCLDGSYIQKSEFTYDAPGYIHYKPNHSLAAIGLQGTNVLLAYRDDDGNLVYRIKTANAGPASLALGIVGLQESIGAVQNAGLLAPEYSISLLDDSQNKVEVKIIGLENDSAIRLFKVAVIVELKEGNKLGALSGYPITNLCKYKPTPQQQKELTGLDGFSMDNVSSYVNNPSNFADLVRVISKSPQFDAIVRCLLAENSDFNVASLGY